MKTRFDLESDIMQCWQVIDDVKILMEHICDSETFESMDPKHKDKISNVLLGIESLYDVKFTRLFQTFTTVVIENVLNEKRSIDNLQELNEVLASARQNDKIS